MSNESSLFQSFATEPSDIKFRKPKTYWQKKFEQGKKLASKAATAVGTVTEITGSIVGGAKLAQVITNTIVSYLPIDSTSKEVADVSYWTLVVVCPFLLYQGVQAARVQHRFYVESRKDQERYEFENKQARDLTLEDNYGEEDAPLLTQNKLKHATALVKSLSTSHNIVALCNQIILQLMDSETLDFRIMAGIASISFLTNYYCQLSVYENADLMKQKRREEEQTNRRDNSDFGDFKESCWYDFDAKRVATLGTLVPASVLVATVEAYGDIDPRQHFYGFVTEVAAIGVLCLCLAAQDKKSFVESKHKGKVPFDDFELNLLEREKKAWWYNKEINRITAAAHLRAAGVGGSAADLVMRVSQTTKVMAIPASLLGLLIYRTSLNVLKKYYARAYSTLNFETDDNLSTPSITIAQDDAVKPPSGPNPLLVFAREISSPKLQGLDKSESELSLRSNSSSGVHASLTSSNEISYLSLQGQDNSESDRSLRRGGSSINNS